VKLGIVNITIRVFTSASSAFNYRLAPKSKQFFVGYCFQQIPNLSHSLTAYLTQYDAQDEPQTDNPYDIHGG
jgi:hypothetical protein